MMDSVQNTSQVRTYVPCAFWRL